MPHVHIANAEFSFADIKPAAAGWETVTVEQFNTLRASGWEPTDYSHIPRAITNADLRRALIAIGINPQLITDHLNALPDGAAKWTALADWEYANYVERAHPMLDQLAPNFDLTPADIDALFKSKPEYPLIGP